VMMFGVVPRKEFLEPGPRLAQAPKARGIIRLILTL
jgi:hypothetical protein